MSASTKLSAWVSVHFTQTGARLFRNFVGGVWAGKGRRTDEGGIYIAHASHVDAGLCVGSSDRIGWTPVVVTPDMVGQTVAVFTAVEEKTLAYRKLTDDQANFLDQVVKAGGLGYVAREKKEGPILNKWPESS